MKDNTIPKTEPTGLKQCTPLPIKNWHAFLTAWNRAVKENDMFAMLGLLHQGFTVDSAGLVYGEPEYGHEDVLLFYFAIADGWRDCERLEVGDSRPNSIPYGYDRYRNRVCLTPAGIRRVVARKAFDILVQNFFKCEGDDLKERVNSLINSEKLFKAITDFFTFEDGSRYLSRGIRNLTTHLLEKPHFQEVVEGFVIHLASLVFQWREREAHTFWGDVRERVVAEDALTRKRLDEARPWAIDVLNAFKRLFLVMNYVQDSDLEMIREIALRRELNPSSGHLVKERRLAQTAEEAFIAGSHAGEFLVFHGVRRCETERLKAILDADEAFQEGQRVAAERAEAIRVALATIQEAQKQLDNLRSQ